LLPPPPPSPLFPYTTLFRSPRRFDLGPSNATSSATRLPAPTFHRPITFTFRRGLSERSVKSQRWICTARPCTENFQSSGPSSLADRKSTRLNSSHVAISYAV